MIKYQDAKEKAFAVGRVPDGYFGETAAVWFSLDKEYGKILTGNAHGYHGQIDVEPGRVADEAEAFWRLSHNRRVSNLRLI